MKKLSMKIKFLLASVLMLGVVSVAAQNDAAAQTNVTPECKVTHTGPIVISGGKATGSFTIPAGCPAQEVSISAYLTHENILPLSSQRNFSSRTGIYGPGTHTISTKMTPDECFSQVDLFRGGPNLQLQDIDYSGVVMAWSINGSVDCIDNPPATETPPVSVNICSPVNSPNSPTCNVTESKPAPAAAPAALPETGPAGVAAAFVGVSTFSTIAYNLVRRRLGSF